MQVTFRIPGPLLPLTGGASEVRVESDGPTLGHALASLWRVHPALRDRILDERGALRPHVNVFVGRESAKATGGLGTVVPPTDEIAIIPAVSGGVC
jgi:molybdopterin converting factor small subunit